MTAMIVVAAWGLYRWRSVGTSKWAIAAGLLVGVAVFVKNVALFPLGLAALMIVLERGWRTALKDRQTWIVAALSVLPVILYTLYGIQAGFLVSQFAFRFFPNLLGTGAFYLQWLGQIDGIVGLGAFCVALAGIFVAGRRQMVFLAGIWLGYVALGMTFAYHVITHDYYSLMLIPFVALALAPATDAFIVRAKSLEVGWVPRAVLAALIVFIIAVQLWNVRVTLVREDWRPEVDFWTMIGEKLGHDGSPVVAITPDYGYRLAYWGWQDVQSWYYAGDLDLRVLDGREINTVQWFEQRLVDKKFLIVTQLKNFATDPDKGSIEMRYPIYAQGEGYIIYDLMHPKKAPK